MYGVEASEITKKNNSWKIRLREKIISNEELFETVRILSSKHVYKDEDAISIIQKEENFPFQRCIDPILKFMEAGETYLLKEFWKFAYVVDLTLSSTKKQYIGLLSVSSFPQ